MIFFFLGVKFFYFKVFFYSVMDRKTEIRLQYRFTNATLHYFPFLMIIYNRPVP